MYYLSIFLREAVQPFCQDRDIWSIVQVFDASQFLGSRDAGLGVRGAPDIAGARDMLGARNCGFWVSGLGFGSRVSGFSFFFFFFFVINLQPLKK